MKEFAKFIKFWFFWFLAILIIVTLNIMVGILGSTFAANPWIAGICIAFFLSEIAFVITAFGYGLL